MKGATPYRPGMPRLWWLQSAGYIRYMLRELTCIFVGAWVVTAIAGLLRLVQGPAAWQGFLAGLGSVPGIAFQVVTLVFVAYHAVSWFALAPSTMPVWIGETRVPPGWIEAAHYLAWIAVTLLVLWIVGT